MELNKTIGWQLELRAIKGRINSTSYDAACILAWLKNNMNNPVVVDALKLFNKSYEDILQQFSLCYYAGFNSEVETALKSDVSDHQVYVSIKTISDIISRILTLLRVHYNTYYGGYYEASKKYYNLLHNLDCLYLVVEASEVAGSLN